MFTDVEKTLGYKYSVRNGKGLLLGEYKLSCHSWPTESGSLQAEMIHATQYLTYDMSVEYTGYLLPLCKTCIDRGDRLCA